MASVWFVEEILDFVPADLQPVIANLGAHGVELERLEEDASVVVEQFVDRDFSAPFAQDRLFEPQWGSLGNP